MGAKTFTTFQSDLIFELGNRDDLDDKKGDWINHAYITLTTMNRFWGLNRDFHFPELMDFSTTSCTDGTAWVQTAERCLYVTDVWDTTNDVHLHNISHSKYVGKVGRDTAASEGDPKYWVVHGATGNNDEYKVVWLYPTPDSSQGIRIYYRKIPAEMEQNADVTDIGVEWDEPLLQLAVVQSHMRLNEFDRAEVKKKEWVDMVSGLIGIYDKEQLARREVRKPSLAYIDRPYG